MPIVITCNTTPIVAFSKRQVGVVDRAFATSANAVVFGTTVLTVKQDNEEKMRTGSVRNV